MNKKNLFINQQITHFVRNDIQGAQVLDIPVDTTVANIQIKVQGSIDQVTLATPSGG